MNSQLSVRIDDQLRTEGTAALESIGFTPSRAIRALWSYAAKNKNNLVKLQHDLVFLEENTLSEDELKRRIQFVEEGSNLLGKAAEKLGLPPCSTKDMTYKEIRDWAYGEHWKEKGYL